jgi:transcriptional regulator with XRE-family HTH domain
MSPLTDEIERSRARFVLWLKWYLANYSATVPSQRRLAALIGVTPSAVTQLLEPGSTRAPAFATLVGFHRLTGFGYDTLLRGDPPTPPPPTPIHARGRKR